MADVQSESGSTAARCLLGIAAALVVYGSLYPFTFLPEPLAILTWDWVPGRAGIRDVLLNTALYMPIGFLLWLSFADRLSSALRVVLAFLGGFALSLTIELLQ